jgi:hypothetical protein
MSRPQRDRNNQPLDPAVISLVDATLFDAWHRERRRARCDRHHQ